MRTRKRRQMRNEGHCSANCLLWFALTRVYSSSLPANPSSQSIAFFCNVAAPSIHYRTQDEAVFIICASTLRREKVMDASPRQGNSFLLVVMCEFEWVNAAGHQSAG
uniref:Putative secreted protein n=1 Tax=Anopheles marajoara TaxID=58244 RepID=A0A2M4C815_9DIPT